MTITNCDLYCDVKNRFQDKRCDNCSERRKTEGRMSTLKALNKSDKVHNSIAANQLKGEI